MAGESREREAERSQGTSVGRKERQEEQGEAERRVSGTGLGLGWALMGALLCDGLGLYSLGLGLRNLRNVLHL